MLPTGASRHSRPPVLRGKLTCLVRILTITLAYVPRICTTVFTQLKNIISVAFFLLDDVNGFKREFSVSDTSCVTPIPLLRTMLTVGHQFASHVSRLFSR